MKQSELKLGVKKLKGKMVKYCMDITPEQSRQLKILAIDKETTIKKMILDAFHIE